MPVKKVGKKFTANNKEYDTEAEANKAYMGYLDKAMGADTSSNSDVENAADAKMPGDKKEDKKDMSKMKNKKKSSKKA